MFRTALAALIATVTASAENPDTTITHKVFFDLEVSIGEHFGRVVFGLYGNEVPKTVENFRIISNNGLGSDSLMKGYKGTPFHFFPVGFMMEGGDVTNLNGSGGRSAFKDQFLFEDENFNIKHHKRGLLTMINYGPNTNGSRFAVMMSDQHWMDGKNVVFGEVIEGMDVIDALEKKLATADGD